MGESNNIKLLEKCIKIVKSLFDKLKPKSKILIIAGSILGGAGIQGDIKTITSLGLYAMTAVTAITSQNTIGVKSIVSINSKEIEKQIIFTCKDIKPDAIKNRMLHSSSIIKSVISAINKIKAKIILDPVMIAKSGTKLINNEAIQILKNKLIKKVILITPNIPEAEILTKTKIKSVDDMIHAGKILLSLGARNVLIKGGHLNTRSLHDIFLSKMK